MIKSKCYLLGYIYGIKKTSAKAEVFLFRNENLQIEVQY